MLPVARVPFSIGAHHVTCVEDLSNHHLTMTSGSKQGHTAKSSELIAFSAELYYTTVVYATYQKSFSPDTGYRRAARLSIKASHA
jgi:hypothetical protein